jgi:hypothetical protein
MIPLLAMAAIQMAPTIMNALGKKPNPYKEARRTMYKANEFAAAAADPRSAMYKAATEEEASPLRSQALAGIENMYKIARRAKARGDMSSIVNPERRDETRSRAIMQAFEQASVLGRQQAQSRLTNAAKTLYSSANKQMGMADSQMAVDEARQAQIQKLYDVGGGLVGATINKINPRIDQDVAFRANQLGSWISKMFSGPSSVGGK